VVFEVTNDLVENLGVHPPMTLEAFIEKHRAAFRVIDGPIARFSNTPRGAS